MALQALCTRQEVFALGLDARAFAARSREVESVDPATGVFLLSMHGLFDGALLRFRVRGEATPGAPSAQLPAGAGLSPHLMYEAWPVSGSSDLFRVAPDGGNIITSFADAGSGVFSIYVDPGPNIDRIAVNETANIYGALTAYNPPILRESTTGLFDEELVGVCARRTAIRAVLKLGLADPIYQASVDKLIAGQAEDNATVLRWIAGRPLNMRPADQNTEPDHGAFAGSDAAPTPWRTGAL